jgi:hypothetical protein
MHCLCEQSEAISRRKETMSDRDCFVARCAPRNDRRFLSEIAAPSHLKPLRHREHEIGEINRGSSLRAQPSNLVDSVPIGRDPQVVRRSRKALPGAAA